MEDNKLNTVSEGVENREKYSADLEQALNVVGVGWYNIKYCLVLALFLISAIVEPMGYGYVLPAAKCDLNMSDAQRGVIASVPYIGIVATSFPWGYLVDTRGRKRIIIYSSLVAGILGVISGFMPELISFTICKSLTALCIACPAAVPYTFIGEILPQKYRDVTLSITNSMQIMGSALVPLLGYGILPLEFRADFGTYEFRSWRLLCMLYSSLFIITAALMCWGPESPKYLVSQGRYDEALNVLQKMYAGNKNKSPDEFPVIKSRLHYDYVFTIFDPSDALKVSFWKNMLVLPDDVDSEQGTFHHLLLRFSSGPKIKRLKMQENSEKNKKNSFLTSLKMQSAPLIKRPYVKWMGLNGFLLFGIFCVLNGLYMWVPDILNRVLSGEGDGLTACGVIAQRFNETAEEDAICDDSIDTQTFIINSIANVSCAFIALAASVTVKFIGKKILLILVYFIIGSFLVSINHVTQDMVFAVLLSSLALAGLAIGPVNAFAVEIFPTQLRGMAVSLSMMIGRTGSVIGTNVAGLMINAACEATFYTFGGLFLLCGLLSFLLPRSRSSPPTHKKEMSTRL